MVWELIPSSLVTRPTLGTESSFRFCLPLYVFRVCRNGFVALVPVIRYNKILSPYWKWTPWIILFSPTPYILGSNGVCGEPMGIFHALLLFYRHQLAVDKSQGLSPGASHSEPFLSASPLKPFAMSTHPVLSPIIRVPSPFNIISVA